MTNHKTQKPFLITTGEPAGIGPDIVLQLWQTNPDLFHANNLHVIADKNLLRDRAKQLNIDFTDDAFPIIHLPLSADCKPGLLNKDNADYVMQMLQFAVDNCMNEQYAGLITGPIHKGILNDAGFKIAGHTDFLTHATHTACTVMMLMTDQLKVALFSDHVPLRAVPDLVTKENLSACLDIILKSFTFQFGIKNPRILVCGLNPHAGENGYLGTEEQTVMIPVIKKYQDKGHAIIGPVAADTAFTTSWRKKADVILAMYHDQGLPTLKYSGFHSAVNVTLGLPFVRTSVDHGTALDIAGSGKADTNSLLAAIKLCNEII